MIYINKIVSLRNKITEESHKTCLSTTSIWIMYPCIISYKNNLWIHVNLFTITCAASMIHWSWYKKDGFHHMFDIVCAHCTIIFHICGYGLRIPNIYLLGLILLGIIYFYNLACSYPIGTYNGLVNHLLFRYLCFWGATICYIPINLYIFIINTYFYLVSIYLILTYPQNINLINVILFGTINLLCL